MTMHFIYSGYVHFAFCSLRAIGVVCRAPCSPCPPPSLRLIRAIRPLLASLTSSPSSLPFLPPSSLLPPRALPSALPPLPPSSRSHGAHHLLLSFCLLFHLTRISISPPVLFFTALPSFIPSPSSPSPVLLSIPSRPVFVSPLSSTPVLPSSTPFIEGFCFVENSPLPRSPQ